MYDSHLQEEHPFNCLMNQPPSPREYHFYLKNNRYPTPIQYLADIFLKKWTCHYQENNWQYLLPTIKLRF